MVRRRSFEAIYVLSCSMFNVHTGVSRGFSAIFKKKFCRPPGIGGYLCPDPGLNRGPLDLQSNALPTELSRPTRITVK